jgi:secreted trypsin-like serine protease
VRRPLALVGLLVSCASPTAPSREQVDHVASPILGGVPDTDHPSIVAVLDGPLDGPHDVCSGVVVAARVVVTAAHCLTERTDPVFHVQLGTDVEAPTRSIDVTRAVPYPRYTGPGDDQRAGLDVAVLVLAEDAGVPAVALPTTDDDGLSTGGSIEVVGFGETIADDPSSAGQRRRTTAPLDALCDRLLAAGDATHTACGGDSGGALLATGTDGVPRLVGIVAFGIKAHCAPPFYATRIAPYRRFIQSFIDGAGDDACVTTCPAAGFCPETQRDAGTSTDASPETTNDAGTVPSSSEGGCGVARRSASGEQPFALVAWSVLTWWSGRTRRGRSSPAPRGGWRAARPDRRA